MQKFRLTLTLTFMVTFAITLGASPPRAHAQHPAHAQGGHPGMNHNPGPMEHEMMLHQWHMEQEMVRQQQLMAEQHQQMMMEHHQRMLEQHEARGGQASGPGAHGGRRAADFRGGGGEIRELFRVPQGRARVGAEFPRELARDPQGGSTRRPGPIPRKPRWSCTLTSLVGLAEIPRARPTGT